MERTLEQRIEELEKREGFLDCWEGDDTMKLSTEELIFLRRIVQRARKEELEDIDIFADSQTAFEETVLEIAKEQLQICDSVLEKIEKELTQE